MRAHSPAIDARHCNGLTARFAALNGQLAGLSQLGNEHSCDFIAQQNPKQARRPHLQTHAIINPNACIRNRALPFSHLKVLVTML